jgi:hypothetical protein
MFESELEAAADGEAEALADAAADVAGAGGAEDVELDELHAASARQLTVAATARKGLMSRIFTRAGLLKIGSLSTRDASAPCSAPSAEARFPLSGTASH